MKGIALDLDQISSLPSPIIPLLLSYFWDMKVAVKRVSERKEINVLQDIGNYLLGSFVVPLNDDKSP